MSDSYPAAAGETIALYASGLGAATSSNGLQVANATPQIFIDRLPAKVIFAGRAPGYAGLDQINVQVPEVPQLTIQLLLPDGSVDQSHTVQIWTKP